MSKQIRVSDLAYMYLEMEAAKNHRSFAGQVDILCGVPPYKKGHTPIDELPPRKSTIEKKDKQ